MGRGPEKHGQPRPKRPRCAAQAIRSAYELSWKATPGQYSQELLYYKISGMPQAPGPKRIAKHAAIRSTAAGLPLPHRLLQGVQIIDRRAAGAAAAEIIGCALPGQGIAGNKRRGLLQSMGSGRRLMHCQQAGPG